MNRITYAIKNLLARRKSVNGIVSKVERGIDELLAQAQHHADMAVNADARAFQFTKKAEGHRAEAQRAERIASRFISLLD